MKLLAAAGYDKKLTLSHFYNTNLQVYAPRNEALYGMLQQGFNLDSRPLDYATEWRQVCQNSRGTAFNGLCYNTASNFNAESYLTSLYTVDGKFRISNSPVPGITDQVLKIKTELDPKRRTEMIKQVQRDLGAFMPNIHMPGFTHPYTLSQPWMQNYGAFSGLPSARRYVSYWYDKSKQT